MSNRAAAEITKFLVSSPQPLSSPPIPSPIREEPVFAKAMGIVPNRTTHQSSADVQVLQTSQETVELSPVERLNVRSNERTVERTNVRKSRRVIRHTFDIYQDQLVALKTLQLKAVQTDNKKVTLGDMVQEAIDLWLKQR